MDLSNITVIDVLLLKQINNLSAIRKNPNLTNHLQALIKKLEDAATPKLHTQTIKEFRRKAKEKFELGAKEHENERWEDIDHIQELKSELLDAYNYLEEAIKQKKTSKKNHEYHYLLIELYSNL